MLALREIRRAKLRFGLLSGAVGLLVFLVLFQQALIDGLITSFVGAVRNQDAPVLVFNEQARKNVEASFLTLEQAEAVAGVPGVARSGLVGQNTFTVVAAGEPTDAVLFGYELGGLGQPTTLSAGRLPAGPGEGVAPAEDARLGFDIGNVVRIVGADGPAITIVGLADEIRWSVTPSIFVSYETFEAARRAVQPDSDLVLPSLVAVEPVAGVDAGELAARITATVPGAEALTRQQAADENPGVRGVQQSFTIVLVLAFAVVVLVVGFFFLILTVQKAKPLTLLRALGAPRSYLVRNLVAQILAVMVGGIVVGVALAALLGAVGLSGDVAVDLRPAKVATTVGALTGLALVGGLASMRRVLRIEPVRATTSVGREV